jgi:hypothetical protein
LAFFAALMPERTMKKTPRTFRKRPLLMKGSMSKPAMSIYIASRPRDLLFGVRPGQPNPHATMKSLTTIGINSIPYERNPDLTCFMVSPFCFILNFSKDCSKGEKQLFCLIKM